MFISIVNITAVLDLVTQPTEWRGKMRRIRQGNVDNVQYSGKIIMFDLKQHDIIQVFIHTF